MLDWDVIVGLIKKVISQLRNDIEIPRIVKEAIFELLGSRCTIIYYPLENEINRGFHIKKIVNGKLEDFVYINTDKTMEQQVFTAAHEMGHVFKISNEVQKLASGIGFELEMNDELEEQITDRFAAELLMPEEEFRHLFAKNIEEFGYSNQITLLQLFRVIAKLMDDFMCPYNSVRKRLFEVGLLKDDELQKYLKNNKKKHEELAEVLKKDNNSPINSTTNVKTISGLRSLIEKASVSANVDLMLVEHIKKAFELEDVTTDGDLTIEIAKVD